MTMFVIQSAVPWRSGPISETRRAPVLTQSSSHVETGHTTAELRCGVVRYAALSTMWPLLSGLQKYSAEHFPAMRA